MSADQHTSHAEERDRHLDNVAANLQFIADLGYGDVALAVPHGASSLRIVADARPMTAISAVPSARVGSVLRHEDEPEAYAALASGEPVLGERKRVTRGISYVTNAYPIGSGPAPTGIVIRDLAQQVFEAPGTMERVFMRLAEEVLGVLRTGPIEEVISGEPFSTTRKAGDGVLSLDREGRVVYASPNAVNIMRLAGVEGVVVGSEVSALPGAAVAITPVLRTSRAKAVEIEAGGRVLGYRSIGLGGPAAVLVEDVTDARRREQELKVKEATIREVHHRVKNNLQTIASLLRIQARRAESEEARSSLSEAMERVSSMAVVHEMLSGSAGEQIDFVEAAVTVVEMVRRALAGDNAAVRVEVNGSTGLVPAQVATSLALVVAELVHNAIEHGIGDRGSGFVAVNMRRLDNELVLTVRDDGAGLPAGFALEDAANLGLAIVRTIVTDDLRGTLRFEGTRGTTVTVRFPLEDPATGAPAVPARPAEEA